MTFDPRKHHRHSIRLKGYDYTQPGGYFITIVTYQRDCVFGQIVNAKMRLNEFGKIVDECWSAISEHFPNVELGAHVVMPNHLHGILVIKNSVDTDKSMSACSRGTIHLPRTQVRGIVPLRNNSKNLYRVPYRQSSEPSRQQSRAGLDAHTMPQVSGKEIITST